MRKLFAFNCDCGNEYWIPKHLISNRKYCSLACAHKKKIDNYSDHICPICEVKFKCLKSRKTKTGFKFCSRKCKDLAQRLNGISAIHPSHYGKGKSYRKKALYKFGTACQTCGYSAFVEMLDVHHLDSDRNNNKLSNLEVLCVWCHALKTRNISRHQRQF